jgi:hypothetical protein
MNEIANYKVGFSLKLPAPRKIERAQLGAGVYSAIQKPFHTP